MGKILSAALFLIFSSAGYAQTAKVIKVSGRKAIVQTPPGSELKVGQTLTDDSKCQSSCSSSGSSSYTSYSSGGKRENSIGGAATISSMHTSTPHTSYNTSTVALNAQYGWNAIKMEYGPRIGFSNVIASGGTTTSILVGGFYDYNLVPNEAGSLLVYGVGGTLDVGTASSAGSSGSAIDFFGGGNVKWFPLKNTVAVRGDAGLQYDRTSLGSGTTTTTGIAVRGGFEIYY